MTKQKKLLACALSISIIPAIALQMNGQQEMPPPGEGLERTEQPGTPTEDEVKQILEQWHESHREVAQWFIENHGQPHEATMNRMIWHDGEWWKRTEIVHDETPHNFPEEHNDFLYQTVAYNVPVEKVGELAELSGSLIVDRVRGELTARSNSSQHTLLLLNVADQVVQDLHTAQSGRDVIAQAWLEGQHADMLERLLFSPEVAHPEPADPGVVYGARPEDEEDPEETEEEDEPLHPALR